MNSDEKIINSIKGLSIDMINEAGSGHPGIALDAAPIIYTLYSRHMNINVNDDKWINRDRFVMSSGHGSALLYSMLYYMGFLSLDNLKKFRKINSLTPGHPEVTLTPGVDMTTGPLGQGIATSVGMAIASKYYNKTLPSNIINYYTYVMCGDGDLEEGISYEAFSLAGTLKLNNLIVLYDSNKVSLDGNTLLTFTDDIKMRFESIGFNYIEVVNGSSVLEIDNAIKKAKTLNDKPTLIEIKTIIGDGSLLAGTNVVHGKPLTNEDIKQLKEKLELSSIPFQVDEKLVNEFQNKLSKKNKAVYDDWNTKYKSLNISEKLNANIDIISLVKPFYEDMTESMREVNGKIMNIIGSNLYTFIGGAADLSSSTMTNLIGKGIFSPINYAGKNIYYGVREHAMTGVSNGLALCGLKPFASTFLAFSDYMKPAIRMTSLINMPVTYVFTHDSITIGSDGATHQPIEQLSMLRNIPNFRLFRPADANEVLGSWNEILTNPKPSAIVLSRNVVPLLKMSDAKSVSKGAYIVKKEKGRINAIIIATGEEVNVAIKVAEELEKEKIYLRVVSMPCVSIYENEDDHYKESLLPAGYKKIVIEFASSDSWYKYVYSSKYLINLNAFGRSGTKDEILNYFKLDYESIKNKIKDMIK